MNVLVLTQTAPDRTTGVGLATEFSLAVYCRTFEHVDVLAITPHSRASSFEAPNLSIEEHRIERRSPARRFMTSVASRHPAVSSAFLSRPVLAAIRRALRASRPRLLIVEDLQLYAAVEVLANELGATPVLLRSHNVMADIFRGFAAGVRPRDLAFRYEMARAERLERRAVRSCRYVAAISPDDAAVYEQRYGRRTDLEIGCGLHAPEAASERPARTGSPVVLYTGSADLRKTHGLAWLVRDVWPHVRGAVPEARLVLAGRGTERFDAPAAGVEGRGFVDSLDELYRRAWVFANPQRVGSGLKIKSITALSYGIAMVTTPEGARGVRTSGPEAFLVASDANDFATATARLLQDPGAIRQLETGARRTFEHHYAWDGLLASTHASLAEVLGGR